MKRKNKLVFLSGDEAFAKGVELAAPKVISAYPITPQTIVVEELAEAVERGDLDSEFIHVESEHSALSCAIGASAMGVRTFTATSSQGLLYMAECLPYAAGGRYPIVMMNANRSIALPWSIYGDQRDSISQLDSGWIQMYPENAQESLDMALLGYYLAEHEKIMNPVMINLDGFVLTHTFEGVEIPSKEEAENFLPPYKTEHKFSLERPKTMAGAAGPEQNTEFHIYHHRAMLRVPEVWKEACEKWKKLVTRDYTGQIETYAMEDAETAIVTLGSITGLVRDVVDELRSRGQKVGLIKLRFLRPFPETELQQALQSVKAVGVLEKDVSFGYAGTVYTNVCSCLQRGGLTTKAYNFIAGLGGRNIAKEQIAQCFQWLEEKPEESVIFVGAKEVV